MAEENVRPEEKRSLLQNEFVRRWLIRVAALAVAFLLGFVPMWLENRTATSDLAKANRDLRRSQLQNKLSDAAINARRAEYEPARRSASRFFTDVTAELDKADSGVWAMEERTQINTLLSGRDEVITLISRGDPASADRLSDLYTGFVKATSTAAQ